MHQNTFLKGERRGGNGKRKEGKGEGGERGNVKPFLDKNSRYGLGYLDA